MDQHLQSLALLSVVSEAINHFDPLRSVAQFAHTNTYAHENVKQVCEIDTDAGKVDVFNIFCVAGVIWFLATPEKVKLYRYQTDIQGKKRLNRNGWLQSCQVQISAPGMAVKDCGKASSHLSVTSVKKKAPLCFLPVFCWDSAPPGLRYRSIDSSYVGRMLIRFLLLSGEWKYIIKRKSRNGEDIGALRETDDAGGAQHRCRRGKENAMLFFFF